MAQLNEQFEGEAAKLIVAEIQALRADIADAKREMKADLAEINTVFDAFAPSSYKNLSPAGQAKRRRRLIGHHRALSRSTKPWLGPAWLGLPAGPRRGRRKPVQQQLMDHTKIETNKLNLLCARPCSSAARQYTQYKNTLGVKYPTSLSNVARIC